MISQESDVRVLALAARYVRRLWEVERTHFLHLGGDYSDELAILLGELDPVDIRNVAEALDRMRATTELADACPTCGYTGPQGIALNPRSDAFSGPLGDPCEDAYHARTEVGTEPRADADGEPSSSGSRSEPALLRSSVPPSFFPESRDAWRA